MFFNHKMHIVIDPGSCHMARIPENDMLVSCIDIAENNTIIILNVIVKKQDLTFFNSIL